MISLSRSVSRLAAAGLVSAVLVLPASAALFTDIPDGSLYQGAVEGLTLLHIVNGYPDGSFGPRKPINRAEFLQLLFKAAKLETDSSSRLCFKDVEAGSWYESAVCTAQSLGIVNGYPDGTFKPGKEVSRGEAMKMITAAFGMTASADSSLLAETYTDVPAERWDAPFISLLIARDVLPLTGQEIPAFHSEWSLIRGDAALLIWSTLQSLQRLPLSSSSSSAMSSSESSLSSSSSSTSSVASSTSSSSMSSVISSSSSASPDQPSITEVTVPFSQNGTATKRNAAVYRFTLKAAKTLSFTAKKGPDALVTPTCTLFKLGASGISNEYYFGTVAAGSCLVRATVGAGDYQFQVSAPSGDTSFAVSGSEVKGDGNDGFIEAKLITLNGTLIRGVLNDTDLGQYYKFTVKDSKLMTVTLTTNKGTLSCLVFPGDDVELESFAGPTCNAAFQYPKGSYVIWVGHDPAGITRHTFSLGLN